MRSKIVDAPAGSFAGAYGNDCYVFKGIPYAKPPVGDLRFKVPQKLAPLEEVFDAVKFGNRSSQIVWNSPDGFYEKEFYEEKEYQTPISEDSLYLNIWTPEVGVEAKRPVLFYIHGGGFVGGTGHEVEFRTNAYARQGIVLVTINYRVGILGFLAHPWLQEEDAAACGNFGILDQIAALEWVKENISEFGGDPGNITICGQSAGGMSVEVLLATRLADGKYQKAIIQSASGYPQFVLKSKSIEDALEMGEKAVDFEGIRSLDELRQVPVEKLLQAQSKIAMESLKEGEPLPYGPVVNTPVLPDSLTNLIEQGQMNKVPTIIGCTKDDITVTEEEAKEENSRIHRSDIAYSLMNEKVNQNPAYVYYFKKNLPGDEAGAFHSSELWYMFGTLSACWRPMKEEDYKLSNQMVQYWSNFIKTGNPNGAGLEEWKKCTEADRYVMKFDI